MIFLQVLHENLQGKIGELEYQNITVVLFLH